jgi:predicted CoA-binding protein
MIADAGLNAHGYRVLTSNPGHHQTAIQSLTLTFGIAPDVVRTLDVLRRQRNVTEYSGETVSGAAVAECVAQARGLLDAATAWLEAHKPELL